ncbi:xyloside xylosyltransferase 1-like [Dermacentor andersoni]|uniref:xyloside xylosyltransferase 1-like n=1 Tax=Dermacentor andersoni TaxID=34620 RepID=UPI0021554D48|nr:xyloside xylosyltransferase 1-like [Dermacentor andersoni]
MQSIAARLAVYSLFVLGVFVIIWCNLSGVPPPKYRHQTSNLSPLSTIAPLVAPVETTTDAASAACEASRTSAAHGKVDVVFVAKWAYRNMKVTRTMSHCLKSMLARTKSSVRFHVLADPQSYMRLSRTLGSVQNESKRKFQFFLYNITAVEASNKEVIELMRLLFFTKDVGRYNDDMFFITEIFHRVFDLERILFIDLDLKFEEDVAKLYGHFDCFGNETLIGIGHDLQPQYRVDFQSYIDAHPGTDVGMPRPGKQGFNTGVMLMDLAAMRSSKLYNELLTYEKLAPICVKYGFNGSLGHQDFFTLIGMEYPELFFVLDCTWNRQLDTGWAHTVNETMFDAYHRCPGKVRVYHANGGARMPIPGTEDWSGKKMPRRKKIPLHLYPSFPSYTTQESRE